MVELGPSRLVTFNYKATEIKAKREESTKDRDQGNCQEQLAFEANPKKRGKGIRTSRACTAYSMDSACAWLSEPKGRWWHHHREVGAEGHVLSWTSHFQTQPVPEPWTPVLNPELACGLRKASSHSTGLQNSRFLSIRCLLLSAKFSGVLRGFASQTALSYVQSADCKMLPIYNRKFPQNQTGQRKVATPYCL